MLLLLFVQGQMNSAITFPAFENGHEVRLVGSPLDRDIIDGLKKDNFHIFCIQALFAFAFTFVRSQW